LKSCGVIGVFRSQTRLEVPAPFATLFLLHISYPPLEAPPTTSPQLQSTQSPSEF
jgi:hypothetical protein